MWKMGVPVATPISLRDLAAGIASLLNPRGRVPAFEEQVSILSGEHRASLVNSGRAASLGNVGSNERDGLA